MFLATRVAQTSTVPPPGLLALVSILSTLWSLDSGLGGAPAAQSWWPEDQAWHTTRLSIHTQASTPVRPEEDTG